MARVAVVEDWDGAHWLTARFTVRGDGIVDPDDIDGVGPETDQGLTLDDALRTALERSDEVGIYLGGETYSAGSAPFGARDDIETWPPSGLDLRPRWDYEPADERRFDRWWIRADLHGDGVSAETVARVLDAEPRVRGTRNLSATEGEDGTVAVSVEYLLAQPADESATEIMWLLQGLQAVALEERRAERERQAAADRATGKATSQGAPGFHAGSGGASVRMVGPDASPDEIGRPLAYWHGHH